MNEEKYGLLPTMDWLDINKLVIDTSYQRTTTSKRSKNNIVKITENFAWSRFAPLIVNDNGNNTYNVIDGQHRLEACKRLGDIKSVPCYIVPPQSVSAQAVDFAQTNTNRVIVNNFEVFKAKVAAGDADLHLAAAKDFIHRNQLYALTLGALLPEESNAPVDDWKQSLRKVGK